MPLPRPPALRAELLDSDQLPADARERALADLERVNHWLLGIGPVRRTLVPRLRGAAPVQTLLDLGTGGGQVPAALARAARRAGATLRVIGVDVQLAHLVAGRRRGHRQLRVAAAAGALPFRDGAVDWSLSTLFFHHFGAAENRVIVDEMRRIARRGAVIVDLRRSPAALALLRLAMPLLATGEIARHDGDLSIAQAWTLDEVRAWLGGEEPVELARRFPFRFSLVLAPRPVPLTPSQSMGRDPNP